MIVRRIEEMTLNAWPALYQKLYDGWVIRYSDGFTKRCNSVIAMYGGTKTFEEKVAFCENYYKERNIRTMFRINEHVSDKYLDDYLEKRGYEKKHINSVLTLDIDESEYLQREKNIVVDTISDDHWSDFMAKNFHLNEKETEIMYRMLSNVGEKAKYFSLKDNNGEIISAAVGIIEDDFFGIYNLVVDEKQREKGFGKTMMEGILDYGRLKNLDKAYLQVSMSNTKAYEFYMNMGFKEEYNYWYRCKE
ncbi:MAG: GNAT family N-acetyltransferase [Firmicutes bacterium]|nr:GNAT family N-acetyltransferase [Bacillota bacterium]